MPFSFGDVLSGLGNKIALSTSITGAPEGSIPSNVADLLRAQQPAPVHKGMFGIRGTFRDILGTLGDAMLASGGQGPIYRTTRDQEKIGDAIQQNGFGTPEAFQAIAAINPQLAQTMYNQQQIADYRMAGANTRQQTADDRRDMMTRGRVAGMLAGAKPGTPEFAKMFEQAKAYAKSKGVSWAGDLDNLTTPEDIDAFVQGGILPEKQIALNQRQQQITETGRHNQATEGIGSRNAGSNEIKANAAALQAQIASQIAPSRIQYNQAGARNADANAAFTEAGGELGAGRGANIKPRRAPKPGAAPTPGKTPPGAPPVGYKNRNGLTFKGGDPNDRRNWQ